jgi:site-specific DNA-cytosine methylase
MIAGPLGGGNDGAGRRSEDDPNLVYGVSVHGNQRGREVFATLNSGGNDGGFRTEPGEHLVATALSASMGHHGHSSPRGDGSDNLVASCLDTNLGTKQWLEDQSIEKFGEMQTAGAGVRRLTPLECERLQGFPDGWTCLCGAGWQGSIYCECADSPRYKQLGTPSRCQSRTGSRVASSKRKEGSHA